MNYRQARIFCISATIILVLLIAGLLFRGIFRSAEPSETPAEAPAPDPKVSEIVNSPLKITSHLGDLSKEFNDLNDDHLEFAETIGLKPISSTKDIMAQKRPVVELRSNDNYQIDKLSHSYPYLVPEAAKLLEDIGEAFNKRLAEQQGGDYKIIATSLLRTFESVNRLKKGNVNSTENSAHLYGTTFDISYVRFHEGHLNTRKHSDGELKLVLAEVLKELRAQGRCRVKFERKQGCFHITATGR